MTINSRSAKLSSPNIKIQDVPNVPTIGTATQEATSEAVNVSFAGASTGGRAAIYRAVSNPGGIEGISYGSSPVRVDGLSNNTSYTFSVRGETSTGATTGYSLSTPAVTTLFSSMVPIATVVANGTFGAFEFSNIPQIYQDLVLVANSRSMQSSTTVGLYARPSSGVYWSGTQIYGDGGGVGSVRFTSNSYDCQVGNTVGNSATSGIFGTSITHFLNYANTSIKKTFLTTSGSDTNGSGYIKLFANSTNSTVAITNIVMYNDGNNNWASGSTFNLYGIRAVGQ
jgi:hypothetical protein